MKAEDLNLIAIKLNELPYDIKVEVLVADLIDSGFSDNDILIQPVSTFKRRFGKDIHRTKIIYDKQDNIQLLIEMTRDGIYDLLPEGMFHQPRDRKHYKNTSDMVHSVKVQRQEEQASRQFFLPIENEIYHIRTFIEQAEKKLFYELENNASNDFLIDFWRLNKYKKYDSIHLLVRFMPILYRLTQNLEYVKICYEMLLKQKVDITINDTFDWKATTINSWSLGEEYLSYTSTLGARIKADLPEYFIKIGPLNDEEINEYIPNGNMYKYLDLLNSYFLPMGYEKNIIIIPKFENNFIDLNNEYLHLGINTTLN